MTSQPTAAQQLSKPSSRWRRCRREPPPARLACFSSLSSSLSLLGALTLPLCEHASAGTRALTYLSCSWQILKNVQLSFSWHPAVKSPLQGRRIQRGERQRTMSYPLCKQRNLIVWVSSALFCFFFVQANMKNSSPSFFNPHVGEE